jgi:hypothetical protein
MTECVYCGLLIEDTRQHDECPNCGADGYTDRKAHTPTLFVPRHKRPLPEDYEPQWDPRERD